MDPVRPTHSFPTRSAIAGLFASALGWTYTDGHKTTKLQDAIRYAALELRPPTQLRDFQTADLGRIGKSGWTRWGIESRGGQSAADNHLLEKAYLADGEFLVALAITSAAPTTLTDLQRALTFPARPLYFGRRCCIPSSPILIRRVEAATAVDALRRQLDLIGSGRVGLSAPPVETESVHRIWYSSGEGPDTGEPLQMWDRRNFKTDRFEGHRLVRFSVLSLADTSGAVEEPG